MELQKGIPIDHRPTEEIIDSLDNCFLCGHSLEFTHAIDFKTLVVYQNSHCPACGVKHKTQQFILQ